MRKALTCTQGTRGAGLLQYPRVTIFSKADPITDTEKAELEAMKEALFGPEKKRSNPGGRVKQCKEFAT